MKNYYRIVIWFGVLYFAGVLLFAVFTGDFGLPDSEKGAAIVALNDISHDASDSWADLSALNAKDYGEDFVILDSEETVIYTSAGVEETSEKITVEKAIKNGYPYQYVLIGNRIRGSVILLDDGREGLFDMRLRLILGLSAVGVLLLVLALFFGKRIKKRIYEPFRDMEEFAGEIAGGNLDVPLQMDRDNMFGVFTESFDIMRDELKESRKREIAAQRRERELVASLSHDLKTPITGIKLSCEVMKAQLSMNKGDGAGSESTSSLLNEIEIKTDNIYGKAEQIEVLVSDLLSSTLEDLGEFKVVCEDVSAKVLGDIVSRYDDKGLVVMSEIPEAMIRIDTRRISQVIGNILSNSYKYAGTGIETGFRLVEGYLEMSLTDHGPGVPPEELALITNKFYRGKQWVESGEEGNGLGLYIARTLMRKMDGELTAENTGSGLRITLTIPLS